MAQRPSFFAALFTALACLALLAACGNRGSLYLPPQESGEAAPAAQSPVSDPAERDDTDDDGNS